MFSKNNIGVIGIVSLCVLLFISYLYRTLNLPEETKGVVVTSIKPDGLAKKAGIKKGDIIVSIGEKHIQSADDLSDSIGSMEPDTEKTVTVYRNGEELKLSMYAGDKEARDIDDFGLETEDTTYTEQDQTAQLSEQQAKQSSEQHAKQVVAINSWLLAQSQSSGLYEGEQAQEATCPEEQTTFEHPDERTFFDNLMGSTSSKRECRISDEDYSILIDETKDQLSSLMTRNNEPIFSAEELPSVASEFYRKTSVSSCLSAPGDLNISNYRQKLNEFVYRYNQQRDIKICVPSEDEIGEMEEEDA